MIWPFNKKSNVDEVMDAIKDNAKVTSPNVVPFVPRVVPEHKPEAKTHYTVGNDDTGNTVLKVGGDGYYTTTLTMNAAGTRQLIKLLSATLQEDSDE